MACWLLLNILGHVWNSSASLSIPCIMRVLRRRRGQAYALLPSDSSPVSPWACSPTYRDLVTPRPLHQFLVADRPPYPLPLPILLPVRTGPFVMLFVHQLEQVGWDPDPVVTDTRALRRKHRPCDHEHIPLGPAHTQSTSFGRSDLILNFCLAAIAVLCHARLLIFSKYMTTVLLFVRYVFRLVPGGDGHGAKAIERGGQEAVARRTDAAKGQRLRRGGAGRGRSAPDRVHVEGVA